MSRFINAHNVKCLHDSAEASSTRTLRKMALAPSPQPMKLKQGMFVSDVCDLTLYCNVECFPHRISCPQISDWRRDHTWKPEDEEQAETYLAQR
jgi:hypothetical protein